MTIIDVHSHALPRYLIERAERDALFGVRIGEGEFIHPGREAWRQEIHAELIDPDSRIAEMDRLGIDVAFITVDPSFFFYREPLAEAIEYSHGLNDSIADWSDRHPTRFRALASLPMQSPAAAAEELIRAVTERGACGALVASRLPGDVPLDDPSVEPVLAAAAELGAPLLIHPPDDPLMFEAGPDLTGFHLHNLAGNGFDMTVAALRLIFTGTLDRHPDLKVVLAHGGGALPYQIGRADQVHRVRPSARGFISDPPSSYLNRFWIDTITFSSPAQAFLAAVAPPDRVVFGTDLPFRAPQMGDPDPVDRVLQAGLDPHALGETAKRLFAATGRFDEL